MIAVSIIVNLTPAEEARLLAEAQQSGLAAQDLEARVLRKHLMYEAMTPVGRVQASLRQWQIETQTEMFPDTSAHELFARWAEEDAYKTDEEIAANDRLWQDFQQGIDDERGNAGMRTLFGA